METMNTQSDVTSTITHEDIWDLLIGFAGAIALDQIRVDELPEEVFHSLYDGGMWRGYRRCHLAFINQLLPTVNRIPSTLLQELARLTVTYGTAIVRKQLSNLFVDAAALGLCPEEGWSAANFFGLMIKIVIQRPAGKPLNGHPRGLMMLWLATTDPLHITEHPETGYGQLRGVVS